MNTKDLAGRIGRLEMASAARQPPRAWTDDTGQVWCVVGNGLLVPLPMSIDEWDAVACAQQAGPWPEAPED